MTPIKRLLDIFLAGVGTILLSPVWIASAIAIKLDDGGPILYRQQRWGRYGTRFAIYKFRTMAVGDPSDVSPVVQQAEIDDPRVTRVGRVLRQMGIDEIPQFVNILRGDMSFVGPRALAVGEVVTGRGGQRIPYEEVPGFRDRLEGVPGLTGPATIFLPKDAPVEEKFEADLDYVRTSSVFGDLRLIFLSIWISLRGRWESREPKSGPQRGRR